MASKRARDDNPGHCHGARTIRSINVVRHQEVAMLGFHKMTHDGTANVVSCEISTSMFNATSTNSRGQSKTGYVLVLDVVPDGAPPFRAETHERFSPYRCPQQGDSLKVRCNPEKRTVEVDLTDDERFNSDIYRAENKRKAKDEHERLVNDGFGTPEPGADADPFRPWE
jgi:hypothetical protein